MADIREQRIFCAEQIVVPSDLPAILKHYSKEVIRNNPENIIEFSAKYFRKMLEKKQNGELNSDMSEIQKPDSILKQA